MARESVMAATDSHSILPIVLGAVEVVRGGGQAPTSVRCDVRESYPAPSATGHQAQELFRTLEGRTLPEIPITTDHVVAETITLIQATVKRDAHARAAFVGERLRCEKLARICRTSFEEQLDTFACLKQHEDKATSALDGGREVKLRAAYRCRWVKEGSRRPRPGSTSGGVQAATCRVRRRGTDPGDDPDRRGPGRAGRSARGWRGIGAAPVTA